jgi:hypothetical protein
MVWYTRTVETVDINDTEESETDRMWRQIDPELYDTMMAARADGADDRGTGPP